MKTYDYHEYGIYRIDSKLHPDLFYIGATSRLRYKWTILKNELLTGKSNYRLLKKHIHKYGIDDLVFTIITRCKKEHLLFWEQYYISDLRPTLNVNKFATQYNDSSLNAKGQALNDMDFDGATLFNLENKLRSVFASGEYAEEIIYLNIF